MHFVPMFPIFSIENKAVFQKNSVVKVDVMVLANFHAERDTWKTLGRHYSRSAAELSESRQAMASTKLEQQNLFHLKPLEPMSMYLIFVRSHETN